MTGTRTYVAFAACMMVTTTVEAATFSLVAVRVNGIEVDPTSSPLVAPQDIVEANILLSDWGTDLPQGARTYQATVIAAAGANAAVLPLGWVAPPCGTCAAGCAGTECSVRLDGACVVPGHDPSQGHAIEITRPDYLFYGQSAFIEIDDHTLYYRYSASKDEGTVQDTGEPKYCGTLRLTISEYACGSYQIGFLNSQSFITDASPKPVVVATTSQPLLLQVNPCKPLPTCTPSHCAIDARMPHHPEDSLIRLNDMLLLMEFDRDMSAATTADFEISSVPAVDPPRALASVTPTGALVTIVFQPRVTPGQWTCVRHLASGRRCCQASLPADADWSRLSEQADIGELLDNLLGGIEPPLPLTRCDIDRSVACGPADLLSAVDLLTGAGAFVPYEGTSLLTCPSAGP